MNEYACTIVVRVLADSPAEASAKLARQVPVSFALHAIEPDVAGTDPDVIRGIERVTGEVYHHTRDEWWAGSDPEQPREVPPIDPAGLEEDQPWGINEVPGG